MGRHSSTSETIFNYPAEVVYDFVTNPANWGRTYKGSGGALVDHLTLPVKFGDKWDEMIERFLLETDISVDRIGMAPDGSGGTDGILTIAYSFEHNTAQGTTLFSRTLTGDFAKGTAMPNDMFAMTGPEGIDRYHAAVMKELDKDHGKGSAREVQLHDWPVCG